MLYTKVHFILLALLLLLCTNCRTPDRFGLDKRQTPPVKHKLPVERDNNKQWRVKSPRVSRGDTLVWVAPKTSDLRFQFPIEIHRYVRPLTSRDSLLEGYLMRLSAGDSLRLVVKRNAPTHRILQYAIFVKNDDVYARGNTPPEIIVQY